MAISRILIEHFRNLNAVDQTFDPSFNFILGDNGSGKTSLLEALFYLAHGRSFKSSVQNRIISYDQPHFTLHGKIQESQHQWSIGLQRTRQGQTKMKINGEEVQRLADLAHLLPIQIITPEGLNLLNGGPSYKRAFLDWGLFHHNPAFLPLWSKLNRLLKQRNAGLTQVRDYQELAIWDQELVKLSQQVSQWRFEYSENLRATIEKSCQLFLPELEIQSYFYQGWDKNEDYAQILERNFLADKKRGFTFSGPQKADFRFRINGLPAEDILSRGQLKLLMCALRLAQGEHLMAQKNRPCIFLIDDFASELDEKKRLLLGERLQKSQSQVFISAIHSEHLKQLQPQQSKTFLMQNGCLIEKD